jgi:hypothetical protein
LKSRPKHLLGLALLGAVATAGWALLRAPQADGAYAYVNGVAILKSDFESYATVFLRPDGSLEVSREQVLLSLINQALVEQAAKTLGLEVGVRQIEEALEAAERLGVTKDSANRQGGRAGSWARVRMFELFKLVRSRVIGPIVISPEAIEAEFNANPDLALAPRDEAVAVIRSRLTEAEAARRWEQWLRSQRRCADIRIVDTSFAIATSTPDPTCSNPEA